MLGTIMIPYDGVDATTPAVRYAELLPSRSVRLVRVEPPFQVLAPGPLENFRPDWRAVRTEQIHQELAPLAGRFQSQGRSAEIVVRFGDPAEEIIAAGDDADLIIMATQGRGTAGRALFGSVADRVSRHAHTSTLLVRAAAAQTASPHIARIVVPLDGSPLAEHALPLAISLATDLGRPVQLVRVVAPDQIVEEMQPAGSAADDAYVWSREHVLAAATSYLDGVAEQLRARGLTVQTDVLAGTPIFVLLDALRPDDLVVMTTQGRGGLERWLLGSVAEHLIRTSPAPVVIVRAASAAPAQSPTSNENPG